MPDPVNTVAQIWLWRLYADIIARVAGVALVALALGLYALGFPMELGIGIGVAGIAALFLYAIGLMVYSLLFPDRIAANAFDRAEREHQAILADYGPGWEQRRLLEDQEAWKRTGRWDLLADYGIYPEERT